MRWPWRRPQPSRVNHVTVHLELDASQFVRAMEDATVSLRCIRTGEPRDVGFARLEADHAQTFGGQPCPADHATYYGHPCPECGAAADLPDDWELMFLVLDQVAGEEGS